MKKQLLAVITLVVLSASCASAQAVWGIRAGLSKPSISFSGSGVSASIDGKFGVEIGPVLYYSLKNNFYINSGLMFSMKSFDFGDYGLEDEGYSPTIDMYYATIPVYAGYSFPVGSVSLYAQAGPYFEYKISESEDSGLNSFNAGLGIMAGINLNRFKVEIGYQGGLVNLIPDLDGVTTKLSSLFLGVSYVF